MQFCWPAFLKDVEKWVPPKKTAKKKQELYSAKGNELNLCNYRSSNCFGEEETSDRKYWQSIKREEKDKMLSSS